MTELKISDSKERAGQEVTGTAIRDLRERHLALEEQCLGQLFKGFFNNKMTVLVFLIIGPMWPILVVPFLIYWLANLGND